MHGKTKTKSVVILFLKGPEAFWQTFCKVSMPEYKLTYFNCKGLGEAIRFLFAYGDIDYEDNRIEERDWVKVKKSEWILQ